VAKTAAGSPVGAGVLIVEDGCEHLLDAIADLADVLSGEWGNCTCRQALGVDDEQGYQGSSAAGRCS